MTARPTPDPRAFVAAARRWQHERNADNSYHVTDKEAALVAATLGPFTLRPPSTEQVRVLLDAVGALMDAEDAGHNTARLMAESLALNAAWRVGGEMP